MSIRLRISVSALFQLWSSLLKPQVSFIVMQDSQSTPGRPVAGNLLLGRAEIAGVFLVALAQALHALAALADAVVDDQLRLELAQIGVKVAAVLLGAPVAATRRRTRAPPAS